MTPAQARGMYLRAMESHGETVLLRRVNPSPAAPTEVSVRARITGYAPHELVGGINQGDRKIIILAEDVEASGFPLPLRGNSIDKVVFRGKTPGIITVDDSTRRIGDTLIAYEIRATG